MKVRQLLWILIAIALVIGAWGLFQRITQGHEMAGYGNYIVWGLWTSMYLYFVEIAAGVYILITLAFLYGVQPLARWLRLGIFIALVSLMAGLLHIFLDLGHPWRFWKVFASPSFTSVMTFMVWTYALFGLLLLVQLYVEFTSGDERLLRVLGIIGLPLAVAFSGGVGALFGVQGARPFWHVGMFPISFLITALASGTAVLAFVAAFLLPKLEDREALIRQLSRLLLIFVVAEALFLFADYSISLYGALPHNVAAVLLVIAGPHWWAFWIIQVLIGLVLPAVILFHPRWSQQIPAVGLAGLMVAFGFTAVRLNIVVPGLAVPEIEALRTAYFGPHLSFYYFPTLAEWAVTIGITALAGLLFLVGLDRLPLVDPDLREA